MFKKIRNRILLINMAMVTSVVIVAFVVVFATTYARVQSENHDKLLFPIPTPRLTLSGAAAGPGAFRIQRGEDNASQTGASTRIAPGAGLSFSLTVDSLSDVVEVNSILDLQPEVYTELAKRAVDSARSEGNISFDGRIWQFIITPFSVRFGDLPDAVSSDNTVTVSGDYNHIRFLDVTDSYRTIRSLIFMLSGLTLAVIAIFYFISRYFANKAIKPMEEAWEMQGRFVTDASHELKTPLSVINATCAVLYSGKEETVESQIKWVDSIMRASVRMSGLVNSMLSLASMADTRSERDIGRFCLNDDVEAVAAEIEANALEKGLNVTCEADPGIEIVSDNVQVRKLLSILLDNAVKYTDSGGEISLRLKKEKRQVTFTVRNTGNGIPQEDMPYIFDRFYRGDPARSSSAPGYGLGLSIAKAIAEKLDIGISVDSVPHEYTEFKLIF